MIRVVVLVAFTLALAACAEEKQPVTLPPLSPDEIATATATAMPSATPSPRETEDVEAAVRETYTAAVYAFYTAHAMPTHRQRAHLQKWETDPLLSEDLDTLKKARKGHYRLVGRPVLHIIDVTVAGDTAVVEDCIDHSNEYWKDARTGRPIAGSRQPAGVWAFTTLTQTADGWRASKATAKQKRCQSG